MRLEGSILEIRYQNEENQYTIANLETEDGDIVVVGVLPSLGEGDHVRLEGELVFHDKFGEQFEVHAVEFLPPTTPRAIEHYLSSGIFPGIGPVTAKNIVKRFGEDTLNIMEKTPNRLLEVNGIGKKTWEKMMEGIQNQLGMRNTFLYLQNLGISLNQTYSIIKKYGEDASFIVSQNPYQLVQDIRGIGFRKADEIALKNNLSLDSPFRIEAGLRYALLSASENDGHSFLPKETLVQACVDLLNLPQEAIREVLFQSILEKDLFLKDYSNLQAVYSTPLYRAENHVAGRLADRMKASTPLPENMEERILDYEEREGVSLAEEQKEALRLALTENLLVISGGPGTGKTTIIKGILDFMEREKLNVILCAPTGRAAKRMEESSGRKAQTIHRLLGYHPGEGGFYYNEENPLNGDVMIVDEASMMDIHLMNHLTAAMSNTMKMILVGDVDQLPSVGPGNVLLDLINTPFIPTIMLHKIFRQSKDSNIVINAHRIHRGLKPLLNEKGKDFFLFRSQSPKKSAQLICDLIQHRLPKSYPIDPLKDIQVLSPTKKGETGVENLNRILQDTLNPLGPELVRYGVHYRPGDKVMQMKNDYQAEWEAYGERGNGLFNGELGTITEVEPESNALWVEFDEGRLAKIEKSNLDGLSLAYAGTIHKAQGSEFPIIIIPLHQYNPLLYTRNLFYTAITRAKDMVILVGDEKVLIRAIQNNRIDYRFSGLAFQLQTIWNNLRGIDHVV